MGWSPSVSLGGHRVVGAPGPERKQECGRCGIGLTGKGGRKTDLCVDCYGIVGRDPAWVPPREPAKEVAL